MNCRLVVSLAALLCFTLLFMGCYRREDERLDFDCTYVQSLGGEVNWSRQIFVSDFNGDGEADILLNPGRRLDRGNGPTVRVKTPGLLFTQKEGIFQLSSLMFDSRRADECTVLAVGDVDGNEKQDILLRCGNVFLLEWGGNEFRVKWEVVPSADSFLARARTAVAIDLDGDGCDEIAAIPIGGPRAVELRTYEWDGVNLRRKHMAKAIRGATNILGGGDVDGDGKCELVLGAFADGSLSIQIFSVINSALREEALYALGSEGRWFESWLGIADFDHNGLPEIVMLMVPPIPEPARPQVLVAELRGGQWYERRTNIALDDWLTWAGDLYGTGRDVVVTISPEGNLRVFTMQE